MNDLAKTLDFLKLPNSSRYLIVIIGGLFSLLFVHFFIEVSLLSSLQNLNLGRIETDLLIIVLAFISGKLLLLLSDFILYVVLLITGGPIEMLWRDWVLGWKGQIRDFFGHNLPVLVSYDDVRNEVTALEMAAAIKEYPSLAVDIERYVNRGIFLKLSLSICLVGAIYVSVFYLIPFILFLLSIFSNNRILRDTKYQIYRGIVKNSHKDK